MKGSWPKVTASVTLRFFATHAMTRLGGPAAEPHVHDYEVTFGWTHEINPLHGYTHEVGQQRAKFTALVNRLHEQDLNAVLPFEPSAEILALWLLGHTEPAYCDHVILRAYEGYEVRVDRALQRSEWMHFLAGRGPCPLKEVA